jgi:hypothetical protein
LLLFFEYLSFNQDIVSFLKFGNYFFEEIALSLNGQFLHDLIAHFLSEIFQLFLKFFVLFLFDRLVSSLLFLFLVVVDLFHNEVLDLFGFGQLQFGDVKFYFIFSFGRRLKFFESKITEVEGHVVFRFGVKGE